MGHIWLCVLLLLSIFLSYGHSQEATMTTRSVVVLQPSWSHFFVGETITLKCEIQGRGDSDWIYEWNTTSSSYYKPKNQAEFRINSVSTSDSGNYSCKGRPKNDLQSSTEWSDAVKLTVSAKPKPVLTVSPPWLSPGASVTLSCEVKESSADWRFYWSRAVPTPSYISYISYTYELLPGSLHGTVEGSYIIHGPTGAGGYVCQAGRGDPVYYTECSEPQFVWSGDLHSSASLTVGSNRTQHFSSESVSLSCEGSSTEWRVKSFNNGLKVHSQSSKPMTRYTWDVVKRKLTSGVYWCESGLGEYSNAVNITVHSGSVILVSPVHPVTEGHSVILQCKYTDSSFANVEFYRNEELIQDETNEEMIIPAVSTSDEGFYKCKYYGRESPQSWMAVTLSPPSVSVPVEQSSPVGLIVGLVVVILLTILLLLLCRYRTSKDPCCVRPAQSQGTNQVSASDQRTNQSGAPDDVYCPLQHANTSVYGVIQHDDDYENDPGYVRPIPYQETNEGSAADHGTNQTGAADDLYCPLQHGDNSVYEELKRSDDDYDNDGMGAELSD